MTLSPGCVLCPACSGVGIRVLAEMGVKPPCTLCCGKGEVTEALAEEFWECVREVTVASRGVVHYRCVTRAWSGCGGSPAWP